MKLYKIKSYKPNIFKKKILFKIFICKEKYYDNRL